MNEQPTDETIWHGRSQRVFESPSNRLGANFPTTHFPVHVQEYSINHGEIKERGQLGSPTNESGYGSGRVSGLELSVPNSQDHSQFNSPVPSSNSVRRRSNLQETTKSMERLNDPEEYQVPVVLETSFDDNEIVTQRIPKANLFQQSQKEYAKSEIQIRPTSVNTAIRYLQSRVRETKYITAVFESANGGLDEMLDDVLKEFALWLGEKSALLGVAVEMHWSVPEKFRSRVAEISLKDGLHRELRNNNRRVLNLYEECRDRLPSNFIESKIEENCSREKNVNAFQGK
ncbi:hypothetical protein FO519_001685 [Halicephalobus sp. NKZ332]|nr:hypothetical protein FO519_001685 [Halicephalobus sp. NKZ332]